MAELESVRDQAARLLAEYGAPDIRDVADAKGLVDVLAEAGLLRAEPSRDRGPVTGWEDIERIIANPVEGLVIQAESAEWNRPYVLRYEPGPTRGAGLVWTRPGWSGWYEDLAWLRPYSGLSVRVLYTPDTPGGDE